jgi:AcrR family transcriptional regulator
VGAPSTPARRRTRDAIVDAAIAVWARDRDATLAEVAAAAETHRATLHRHFPGRSDLVDAAVRRAAAELVSATEAAAVDQGPPLDALRRVAAGYLAIGDRIRFLFEDPAIAGHPAVAELVAADGPVLGLIRRAQDEGVVDPGLPAGWIERSLWALVFTASEAIDDGLLAAHDAPEVLRLTLERGIAGG